MALAERRMAGLPTHEEAPAPSGRPAGGDAAGGGERALLCRTLGLAASPRRRPASRCPKLWPRQCLRMSRGCGREAREAVGLATLAQTPGSRLRRKERRRHHVWSSSELCGVWAGFPDHPEASPWTTLLMHRSRAVTLRSRLAQGQGRVPRRRRPRRAQQPAGTTSSSSRRSQGWSRWRASTTSRPRSSPPWASSTRTARFGICV